MKTCFEITDLMEDIKERKTPLDNRTHSRKMIVRKVKEITVPHYNSEYGIFCYLWYKDYTLFTSQLNNTN